MILYVIYVYDGIVCTVVKVNVKVWIFNPHKICKLAWMNSNIVYKMGQKFIPKQQTTLSDHDLDMHTMKLTINCTIVML